MFYDQHSRSITNWSETLFQLPASIDEVFNSRSRSFSSRIQESILQVFVVDVQNKCFYILKYRKIFLYQKFCILTAGRKNTRHISRKSSNHEKKVSSCLLVKHSFSRDRKTRFSCQLWQIYGNHIKTLCPLQPTSYLHKLWPRAPAYRQENIMLMKAYQKIII